MRASLARRLAVLVACFHWQRFATGGSPRLRFQRVHSSTNDSAQRLYTEHTQTFRSQALALRPGAPAGSRPCGDLSPSPVFGPQQLAIMLLATKVCAQL